MLDINYIANITPLMYISFAIYGYTRLFVYIAGLGDISTAIVSLHALRYIACSKNVIALVYCKNKTCNYYLRLFITVIVLITHIC